MEIPNLDIKKEFFNNLNERQRRQFAAIVAKDLGFGGQLRVSSEFNIEADTIRKGAKELKSGDRLTNGRVRQNGGGAKKKRKPPQD